MSQMAPQQPSFWSSRLLFWAALVLVFAIFYNSFLHHILFVIFALGRQIQPVEDFPWTCSRVHHPLLESCEDMWLDHQDRKLYAACTTVESRGWCPGANKYNVSARSLTDHITVLDIDDLDVGSGQVWPRQLKIGGYPGPLDLHALEVRHLGSTPRFWLINHNPFVDPATGEPLDGWTNGANSTIEIFDLDKATETLHYVKTIAGDALLSPNNLAVDADGVGILISNDHSSKTGTFRDLEALWGSTGGLTYCRSDVGECHIVDTNGRFSNGVARSRDGLYYVAQPGAAKITVHQFQNGQLKHLDTIPVGYGVDNLSFDEDGTLFGAAIPLPLAIMKNAERPHEFVAPSTVFGISPQRINGEWETSKIIEDSRGEKLPFSTIAVHDTRRDRLFLGGIFAPFITICEKQETSKD